MIAQDFTQNDVEILSQQTVYQGYFSVEKYQIRHRLFNGEWSQAISREVFERGHAAAALLFDPVLNKIVLIEQFRMGAFTKNDNPWLLELVAGIIDAGENPTQVAIRETEEEAGLTAQQLIPICKYWASPGVCTETIALFCAQVDASNAGGIHGLATEDEDIRVHVVDLAEAYSLVTNGQIKNAPTIIALQWLQLHEQKVRDTWLKQGK